MNKVKQLVFCSVLILVLNQGFCEDLNIPQGEKLHQLTQNPEHLEGIYGSRLEKDLKFFEFNKNPMDWNENDLEALRTALKNEAISNANTKPYRTNFLNSQLMRIDRSIDWIKSQMKQSQLESQEKKSDDKIDQLFHKLDPFMQKADSNLCSKDDVLPASALAQIKAVENEYEDYVKQHDIRLDNSFASRGLKLRLEKIHEHQNSAVALYEDWENQRRKAQHNKYIALAAAAASLVASVVIYVSRHQSKLKKLKSKIELLAVLKSGTPLAEEKKMLDKEIARRDSKWEKLKPQIVEHLIKEYKPLISGDAKAIILESVAARIEEGVQDFQSFLPPSARLPSRHYAQFLFSNDDVEQYKAEQSEIVSLLEKEIKPNFQKETIDLG